jgi:small subunit ribosomal protein S8
MYTDPISDMLTRIRNAGRVEIEQVQMPSSKEKVAIADTLKQAGYITDYEVVIENKHPALNITLKYKGQQQVITGLKRVSKPSCRVYVKVKDIPRVRGGLGTVIMSTPTGIITGKQAKEQNVGGEVICYVW